MHRIALPGLVITPERMEFAYQCGADIFIIRCTPRPGAPSDPTKLDYDSTVYLFADDGNGVFDGDGELVKTRNHTITVYNDPSINGGTTQTLGELVAQTVEHYIETWCQPWAGRVKARLALHEELAAADLPPPTKDGAPVAVDPVTLLALLNPPPTPEAPPPPPLIEPMPEATAADFGIVELDGSATV